MVPVSILLWEQPGQAGSEGSVLPWLYHLPVESGGPVVHTRLNSRLSEEQGRGSTIASSPLPALVLSCVQQEADPPTVAATTDTQGFRCGHHLVSHQTTHSCLYFSHG